MVVICQWKALGASFQNLASKSGNPGKNPEKIRIFGSVIQTAISSPFFKKNVGVMHLQIANFCYFR